MEPNDDEPDFPLLVLWSVSRRSSRSNLGALSRCAEKLEGEKLNVAEVTQSEIAQKQKLQTVLERINDSLKLSTRSIRWNVDCEEHLSSLLFISFIHGSTFPVFQNFVSATQTEHSVWRDSTRLFVGCGETADISASASVYTKQPA